MSSQPLPSGFPYIRGKLFFSFFISVERTYLHDVFLTFEKELKCANYALISRPCLTCGVGPGLAEGPGDVDGGVLHFQLQELARPQPHVTTESET
jgi:hypothetical protein